MVQIDRIELVTANLDAVTHFYVEALGFEVLASAPTDHEAGVRRVRLGLGQTRLELLAFDRPGAAYPATRAANDPWFQHFAIAVSDMAAAYAHLSKYPHAAISSGGPQLLPPSTGSVTAYKFRDPDGHPLELSFNPAAVQADAARVFVGIDHSAVAVADIEASIGYYAGLGFTVAGRLVNTGVEQDRLDGLAGVVLDIVVLTGASGPHLELLHYRDPRPGAGSAIALADTAATRLVLSGTGASGLQRDPDGHWIDAA